MADTAFVWKLDFPSYVGQVRVAFIWPHMRLSHQNLFKKKEAWAAGRRNALYILMIFVDSIN